MPRNLGLDLLRILATSMVFYSHSVRGTVKGVPIGSLGVELFFVLSGFLVGRYFFITGQNYNLQFVFRFIAKRWLRTLPLYYFVITLKIFLTGYTFSNTFSFYTFTQNYCSSISFFPVSWSLSIEEWFYLLLPLLALFVFKAPHRANRIILVITIFYILETLLRVFSVIGNDNSWEIISVTPHMRMDSLLTGFLLVFIKYNYTSLYDKLKVFRVFFAGSILAGLYLAFFGSYYQTHQINTFLFFRSFGFVLLSLFIAMLIPYAEKFVSQKKIGFKGLVIISISAASELTYPFYLIHLDVIKTLKTFNLSVIETVIFSLLISLILSGILHICIEKPFLTLKNKIKIR
jgi:peptidoglycan/LPS O-acetylase OafA/YrhL